jgi:16S rRNA (adenine1518-N6/adenine1519-N6)-dimethyltransferase
MHDKRELDRRMELAGIKPLKKLGQNFLLNPKICESLVVAVSEFNPATVVEIGPGLGALTDNLLKGSWRNILVEVDSGLVEFWKKQNPELEVIHKDALHIEWQELKLERPSVLVSNLPYSIAASLVVELSSTDQPFSALVLMFQKEVAERIAAPTSSADYGMLSVIAQANWKISKLIDAGPQDFFPVPHVGSRVLTFTPLEVDFSREKFLGFVKLAYSQRRKKLVSNLSGKYPRSELETHFSKLSLSPDTRAQELTPEQFIALFKVSEKDGI